jgi:hypothetical protein
MLRGIQREFYPWFAASRPRFAVPVTIGRRVRYPKRLRKLEWLELKVVTPGYTFRPVLSSHGLRVPVFVGNELWDIVYGVDWIRPRRVWGGYVSPAEGTGYDKVYPSPGGLWRERVFEPFLSWINLELAKASSLAFHREGDVTWVKLIEGELEVPMEHSFVHLVKLEQAPAGDRERQVTYTQCAR